MALNQTTIADHLSLLQSVTAGTPAAQAAIENYYNYLSSQNVAYGDLATQVATNTGAFGEFANTILIEGGFSSLLGDLKIELAIADANLRNSDLLDSGSGILQADQIAQYHYTVYDNSSIPRSAWGGAFFEEYVGTGSWMEIGTSGALTGDFDSALTALVLDLIVDAPDRNGVDASESVGYIASAVSTVDLGQWAISLDVASNLVVDASLQNDGSADLDLVSAGVILSTLSDVVQAADDFTDLIGSRIEVAQESLITLVTDTITDAAFYAMTNLISHLDQDLFLINDNGTVTSHTVIGDSSGSNTISGNDGQNNYIFNSVFGNDTVTSPNDTDLTDNTIVIGGHSISGTFKETRYGSGIYRKDGITITKENGILIDADGGTINVEDWSISGDYGIRLKKIPKKEEEEEEEDTNYIHEKIIEAYEWFRETLKGIFIDPLVLDLDGDGIELLRMTDYNIQFDLTGDGLVERIGWVAPDDGLLVNDINGNGTIDNISELYGNQTQFGFEELAEDEALNGVNTDRFINAVDNPLFNTLQIWRDLNSDGQTQAGELSSLSDYGITQLDIREASITAETKWIESNQIVEFSNFTRADGTQGDLAEVLFLVDSDGSMRDPAGIYDGSDADLLALPKSRGYGNLPSLQDAMDSNTVLRGMVEDFGAQTSYSQVNAQILAIIYEWAGVTNESPTGRGLYVDGQELAALEEFFGVNYVTDDNRSEPNFREARLLNQAWDNLFATLKARLLIDGPLKDVFSDVSYSFAMDEIAFSDSVDDVLDNLAASNLKYNAYAIMDTYDVLIQHKAQFSYDHEEITHLISRYLSEMSNAGLLDTTLDDTFTTGSIHAGFSTIQSSNFYDQFFIPDSDSAAYITLSDSHGKDVVITGAYDDVITVTGGNHYTGEVTVYGGEGNNTITSSFGNDYINTGDGNDSIYSGYGSDYIDAGNGLNTIYTSRGDDTVIGGSDRDVIVVDRGENQVSAGGGDNLIQAISGTINLSAGSGDDTFQHANLEGENYINLGEGNNTVEQWSGQASRGELYVTVGSGNDSISVGGGSNYQGKLVVYAGAGDDTINAEKGNDSLFAGDGNDSVNAGSGDDYIDLGEGNNWAFASHGHDTILAGSGNDIVSAIGHGGTFDLGEGNNKVSIQGGTYSVITGDGDDNIQHRSLSGSSVINLGNGDNTVGAWDGNGSDGSIHVITGTGADTIQVNTSTQGVVLIESGAGNDTISTGAAWDSIMAGEGNDSILASGGNDYIDGGAGNDVLNGQSGDDTLHGGEGSDRLIGFSGNDVFTFNDGDNSASQMDIIELFSTGGSLIDLSGTSYTGLQAGAGAGTVLGYQKIGSDTIISDDAGNFALKLQGYEGTLNDSYFVYGAPEGQLLEGTLTGNIVAKRVTYVNVGDYQLLDWNNDGQLDIVTDNGAYGAGPRVIDGLSGAITTLSTVSLGDYRIVDFDGDGTLDIVSDYMGGLGWFDGGDLGQFNRITYNDAGNYEIGDFDGDGNLDIISSLGTYGSGAPISGAVWYNAGGTLTRLTYNDLGTFKLADMDGDGALDVVAVGSSYGNGASIGGVVTYEYDEVGPSAMVRHSYITDTNFQIAQLDDDIELEIITNEGTYTSGNPVGGAMILEGNTLTTRLTYNDIGEYIAFDADGDGVTEIVSTQGIYANDNPLDGVIVYEADGTFWRYGNNPYSNVDNFDLADWDNDGVVELISQGGSYGNGLMSYVAEGGNDPLTGWLGDDTLIGGRGDDTLEGGYGADTFRFERGYGHDVVTDFTLGTDTLEFHNVFGITSAQDVIDAISYADGNTIITTEFGSITLNGITDLSPLTLSDVSVV